MFKPYLAQLLGLLAAAAPDFVVEGELVIPSHIPSLSASYPLRSVFLVRSHTSSRSCWTRPGRNRLAVGSPGRPSRRRRRGDQESLGLGGPGVRRAGPAVRRRRPPTSAAAMHEAEELLGLAWADCEEKRRSQASSRALRACSSGSPASPEPGQLRRRRRSASGPGGPGGRRGPREGRRSAWPA